MRRFIAAAFAVATTAATAAACREDSAPPDPAAAKCIAAAETLATDLAPTEQRLRGALATDRAQAAQLLRDSVELVLVTRELLCSQVERAKVEAAVVKLEAARRAFDALLAATTAPERAPNEAELVDRFSKALLGR